MKEGDLEEKITEEVFEPGSKYHLYDPMFGVEPTLMGKSQKEKTKKIRPNNS